MKFTFKNPFKRFKSVTTGVSSIRKVSFVKANKQFAVILGVVFIVSLIMLICYWFFKEKPYYEKIMAGKDELIKTLKFTRDKQKKIYENAVAMYEAKLKNDYILKSVYDEKVNDYEQKLTTYKNDYISKEIHEKKLSESEKRLTEEYQSKQKSLEEEYEQKINNLEQKVSILEDQNVNLKTPLEKSKEFVKVEKDSLEDTLFLERKKALIPSIILPETKNKALAADVLKKLVTIKDKLKSIEEMNLTLKPETYFEMGLVSYYNKQYNEAIEAWENAVSLNKNNIKAYVCLGIVYHEQKMTDNAIKVLHRALEINPKFSTIHLTLARVYEQKGNLDNAISEYIKILEISPEAIDIHKTLGVLYEKKGLKEEAKKSFAQYEKLKSGNTQ
ncbi:MAG: tetratricopeptide repeat protein [Candidatus Brocadiaceae bacterium]